MFDDINHTMPVCVNYARLMDILSLASLHIAFTVFRERQCLPDQLCCGFHARDPLATTFYIFLH